jgi:hypothetical protein
MATKMITYDILEGGKRVGQQTHPEEFSAVLYSGQTARIADVEKVKAPEPSSATVTKPSKA